LVELDHLATAMTAAIAAEALAGAASLDVHVLKHVQSTLVGLQAAAAATAAGSSKVAGESSILSSVSHSIGILHMGVH
jgi:hypothetical protein